MDELKGNDNISEDEIKKAEDARDELKAAIEANDLDQMKEKRDALMEVVQNLSVKLYEQAAKQAQSQEASQANDGQSASDDNVVDADFEEVDE